MTKKKGSFFMDGISLDETKVSLIMITYLAGFIYILVMGVFEKTIPEMLREIMIVQLAGITTMNVSKVIRGQSGETYISNGSALPMDMYGSSSYGSSYGSTGYTDPNTTTTTPSAPIDDDQTNG